MTPLFVVAIFTGLIHLTETLALSMRLAGVKTRQVATALSFLTVALLISRMSNMFQAPFLGGMVDAAILQGVPESLEIKFRFIILAAFVGALIAAFLVPTFVKVFTKGIYLFEKVGSVPRVFLSIFTPQGVRVIITSLTFPKIPTLKDLSLKNIPKSFLILNLFIGSLYAIGVLSALYAGALVPAYRTMASQLSGIVNGVATILLAIMVDPPGARITDQAVRGFRSEKDVKAVVFYLVMGRVLGTLIISQLFFLPCTAYIKWVTLFLKEIF